MVRVWLARCLVYVWALRNSCLLSDISPTTVSVGVEGLSMQYKFRVLRRDAMDDGEVANAGGEGFVVLRCLKIVGLQFLYGYPGN